MKRIIATVTLLAAAAAAADAPPRMKYAIVASPSAPNVVVAALAAKYGADPRFEAVIVTAEGGIASGSVKEKLRAAAPRYAAFVTAPEENNFKNVLALRRMMRELDSDPFDDAVWGIVSGPDSESAMRMALSGPMRPRSVLSTTGVSFAPFDAAFTISDGYAKGHKPAEYSRPGKPVAVKEKTADGNAERIVRDDTSAEFAKAWERLDPELIVTSAHASQRNLEMPFSTGNIVPSKDGSLRRLPVRASLIDYATGQAKREAAAVSSAAVPLARPSNDKIWIAAGNCLIGDWLDSRSMVSCAIGYGRVNQFMGYIATTWFGEVGWGTLSQFFNRRATAAEAWYFANENMIRKLAATCPGAREVRPVIDSAADYERKMFPAIHAALPARKFTRDEMQRVLGRFWDRDATVFYGDPALDARLAPETQDAGLRASAAPAGDGSITITLEASADVEAGFDAADKINPVQPLGLILPRTPSGAPWKVVDAAGCEVFAADDFAFVTRWPAMAKGEKRAIRLAAQ